MKILNFEIVDLWDQPGIIKGRLEDDLNILTGRNGSGKTTVLKLLWYIISGNIQLARQEIRFSTATIETDEYKITAVRHSDNETRISLTRDGKQRDFQDQEDSDGDIVFDAEQAVNAILSAIGGSVFFPTFRRIEGGFSTERPANNAFMSGTLLTRANRRGEVEEALNAVSTRLSNSDHRFVSAISTTDVTELLIRQYTEISESTSNYQRRISQQVIDDIREFQRSGDTNDTTAEAVLETVKGKIESIDADRARAFAPFDAVQATVVRIFKHSGIAINRNISFGDAAGAINSSSLSAGEKQLLSFICYNAFFKNSIIFIDEPELSLHVDWQRTLFPILREQGTNNQFIIATHSPFIYSKFPEKEISLHTDKGDDSSLS